MPGPDAPLAVLTRPQGRNEVIAQRLRAEGLAVAIAPALVLRPLEGSVPAPDDYDMLVFVSRQAVERYFAQWTGRWPVATLAAGVGQATAGALRQRVPADRILAPPLDSAQDSEALMALIDARGPLPARALILRGQRGREWLAAQLERRGCEVHRHALYGRDPVRWTRAQCLAAIDARPCILLVSSLEGLAAIADSLGAHGLGWPPALRAVTIHERIARQLQCLIAAWPAARDPCQVPDVKICAPDEQSIFQAILAASRLPY
ncbi:uroporphyrinogen-III synthase [Castellaniella sp. GW247-6E4]|uniref:uroporphyrinogen-III synthase n=1 Tax=Castellaniella sp. GW247-6E4 TaxID=3140380 RepID=UPI0033151DD6